MHDEPVNLEEQVIELQTRLAFTEHSVNELNDALISQQTQIERLANTVQALSRRLAEVPLGESGGEEPPPPHY
jgi:SlyX protein